MPQNRPRISADLERRLLLETGGYCAMPGCSHPDVDIAHIVPHAEGGPTEFHNLICLCPNHHRLYDQGKTRIDRKAMLQIKANLAIINDRYCDFERRILDWFAIARRGHRFMQDSLREHFGEPDATGLQQALLDCAEQQGMDWTDEVRRSVGVLASAAVRARQDGPAQAISIPDNMVLQIYHLLRDGFLAEEGMSGGFNLVMDSGSPNPVNRRYLLTESGARFVDQWVSAETIAVIGRDWSPAD